MGKQILESNNYARFELTAFNRDAEKTKLFEMSMLKHGWIDACPLHVVRTAEGKLLIKQGIIDSTLRGNSEYQLSMWNVTTRRQSMN